METNTNTPQVPVEVEAVEPKPFKPYKVVCAVTGAEKKTNPKQFNKTADLIGVTPEELFTSYVGREGKKELVTSGLTKDQLVNKYKLHPKVAEWVLPAPTKVVEAVEV